MNKDIEKFLPPEEKNVDNDYKYSRDTYYELVEKGKESLELMIEVARESEHPRAFEVLSGMIKNISDVNDRLMDLNKKKKDLDKKEEIKNIANTTNNLFVGSTAELQKILKNESEMVDVTPKPEPKLSR
jgi:predicted RNase H-like HicB family nuclease|tara:strand:- start:1222 stop:1608 length:387 start_codon:yes stop_codon:yes gene_type:complete